MKMPTQVIFILKKMRLSTQILIGFLIVTKIVLGSVFIYRVGLDTLFFEKEAIASEIQKDSEVTIDEDDINTIEEKIDISFLKKKKASLLAEEKKLSEKEAELRSIQEEINNKIAKLTQLRNEIRSEMAKEKTAEEQKYKHLIKVFSAMKPQSAADLIEKLDKKLTIELLSRMKGDNVGKILSFVDIEKAAVISEGLAKVD